MSNKMRDFYAMKKNAAFVHKELWLYTLDTWIEQGYLKDAEEADAVFGFDKNTGKYEIDDMGWCESAFWPRFENKILEDRGAYELVQDFAGRGVLYFKGRRDGFMPEYVTHPVTDKYTWEKDVKWRLDPKTPERTADFKKNTEHAKTLQAGDTLICQRIIGPYMYLRSLLGPEGALYMFYDDPELIVDCMKSWLMLNDALLAVRQRDMALDELFFAEDICYNGGPLISPEMIRKFLFPYYNELITNAKERQKGHKLFIQIDTDGDCRPVIDLYKEIGINFMSPFEVASGCDVVEIRKKYPELLMSGGFDKRILATTKDEIDREIDRIMPFMKEHGGYIPTVDHAVPLEVSFENYLHFRKRMMEF